LRTHSLLLLSEKYHGSSPSLLSPTITCSPDDRCTDRMVHSAPRSVPPCGEPVSAEGPSQRHGRFGGR
jgi:hypothetical protein